jgi:hypothetical protein
MIIGAAIIADDFIRPHPHHSPMTRPTGHATPPFPREDHKVWVMKQGGDADMKMHREMRIIMDDESESVDHEKTIVMVKVEDDELDATASGQALAEAIREVVDAARAEGREPTEEEITAAVTAVSGKSSQIEVEVDVTGAQPLPD